jgi:hypothetical protein
LQRKEKSGNLGSVLAAVAEWQTHLTQNQAGNRAGSSPAGGMKEREISPFFMPFSSPIKFYSSLKSAITICFFN